MDGPDEDGGLARLLSGLGPEECYEIFEVSVNGVQKLDPLNPKPARPSHKRAFILRRKATEQNAWEAAVFASDGTFNKTMLTRGARANELVFQLLHVTVTTMKRSILKTRKAEGWIQMRQSGACTLMNQVNLIWTWSKALRIRST